VRAGLAPDEVYRLRQTSEGVEGSAHGAAAAVSSACLESCWNLFVA
jgi:hypothetical protein